jgi:hypothetical protein
MDLNDFALYKEDGNILSMGFKINNNFIQNGLPIMYGGSSPFNKNIQNQFTSLNIPLPLVMINQKFEDLNFDQMGGNKLKTDAELNTSVDMHNIKYLNESLMDTILGLTQTGSGIKTKKLRIRSSKNKTKKLY